MKTNQRSRQVAIVAILIALATIIQYFSTVLYGLFPLPIKPTLMPIVVILASVCYGPKIGAILGTYMGLYSVVYNTVVYNVAASFLFSPFVPNGNLFSFLIALVPRILIGVVPYYIYKLWQTKGGLFLAGAMGALTNTVFVLSGIFIFFQTVYQGDVMALLGAVFASNSIIELLVYAFVTMLVAPRVLKATK
ncbi:ECF transporter S component [Streptococcus sp. DD12]|uniref:ECF transporter S component n=1 Tax=Streptococcus sp. DD12 TaxID=1777880 RepID=UPI0007987529|nr:ECF transporter S component [Streptococcus sp. DD12]KXT76522.1 Substrate-specific component PanT of putative pantothenate ECF transporter [Streptococcus sp. DD12]